MDSKRPMEDKIVIEKLAVITFDDVVSEPAFRRYLERSWKTLTEGLNNGSTILFIGGVHGDDKGKLGPRENIQTLKNQVRILKGFLIQLSSNFNSLFIVQARSS